MRSTLKCDIIRYDYRGVVIMKTKIIYISGNEVFDMKDIRTAFNAVRETLNLDKDTVLFGVPVDADDAQIVETENTTNITNNIIEPESITTTPEPDIIETENIITDTISTESIIDEPVTETIDETITETIETPVKKRGRPRKFITETEEPTQIVDEPEQPDEPEITDEEKIVPILSILSANDTNEKTPDSTNVEIIEDVTQEEDVIDEPDPETVVDIEEQPEDLEPDLEQLLSAMKPLQEDIINDDTPEDINPDEDIKAEEDETVDATLAQLASEFAQNEDKIATETKNSKHGKIGKLRNILPFKQSKHKDQGLGDLFGWAGVAANDEDFSVPGFFTNAASRK